MNKKEFLKKMDEVKNVDTKYICLKLNKVFNGRSAYSRDKDKHVAELLFTEIFEPSKKDKKKYCPWDLLEEGFWGNGYLCYDEDGYSPDMEQERILAIELFEQVVLDEQFYILF